MKKPLLSRHPKLRFIPCVSRYGVIGGTRLFRTLSRLLKSKTPATAVEVSVPGLPHPVYLRPGTSDTKAFIQVLLFQEYAIDLPFTPKTILDGGANIGMTAVYFANRYPDATIVSVEPDTGNFETLQKNVAAYSNIIPVQGGLWSKTTQLIVRQGELGEWNFIVEEAPAGTTGVPAFAIPDLMARYAPSGFDLVKMDIEGSEVHVLGADNVDTWLARSQAFITELHDRQIPGCSRSFLNAIQSHDFALEPWGESIACIRRS